MIRRRIALPFLLAVCFLWPHARCVAQPTPTRLPVTVKDADATLENEWFGVYFQGDKIGYFNNSRQKVTEGGDKYYREKFIMSMKLQSLGQKMEMKIEESLDFEAKPPFRLVRADYVHTDDKIKTRTQLATKDKGYEATLTVNDTRRTKMLNDLDFCLADSISTELWIKNQPKKGDKITTRDLDLDELKIEMSTATLMDTKESLVNGVKILFHEVQSLNHKTNIVSAQKLDDQGRLISGTIAGVFELRRESEADAKNTKFSADLFILGMATLDKPIGDTNNLKCLVLEVKSNEVKLLPDGPRQTLEAKGDGIYHLCIGQKYGKLVKASDKEIKDGLAETVAYPIHDPKIMELAKKAAGDAKTDEEKAKSICKFVKDFIAPSLEGTLPKMHDLLERKKGDCKSYALMFTCLARAAGLPSREVSGFVYMGNDIKGFGGHAWNEVLLDGYWVPVDASMNQVDCDATHICLGTDKESSNNLLKTFGKLNFKLVQVERGN